MQLLYWWTKLPRADFLRNGSELVTIDYGQSAARLSVRQRIIA